MLNAFSSLIQSTPGPSFIHVFDTAFQKSKVIFTVFDKIIKEKSKSSACLFTYFNNKILLCIKKKEKKRNIKTH